MSQKVVFFGNERIATGVTTKTPVLAGLIKAGYDVTAVVVNQAANQSRKDRELEVQTLAKRHEIALLSPNSKLELMNAVSDLDADIGILVAYGRIIPQEVIDRFNHGIINIHPSLLPLHRGPIPLESVLLEGITQTGVSVMQLTAEMDAGPLYAQKSFKLAGRETKQKLADKLLDSGRHLLLEVLPGILDGTTQPTPQSGTPTYDKPIKKADGVIDWKLPSAIIERQVRAYFGWPGSRTHLCGSDVIITEAHIPAIAGGAASTPPGVCFKSPTGELAVSTGDGTLVIDRLKPAGKTEMTGKAFLAGRQL